MDNITLTGILCHTIVGVYDWERVAPRPVVIDLVLDIDSRECGASDSIDDTIDYSQVAQSIMDYCKQAKCYLLEALAEQLASMLLDRFQIDSLELTIHKPKVLDHVKDVAITIRRQQKDFS